MGLGGLGTPAEVAIAGVLLCFSGLFSGLNLGLLALDPVGLEVAERAGQGREREWAKAVRPVRERGNLLLVTLLMGNTLVNSAIAIILSDITSGWVGLAIATSLILVFGEVGGRLLLYPAPQPPPPHRHYKPPLFPLPPPLPPTVRVPTSDFAPPTSPCHADHSSKHLFTGTVPGALPSLTPPLPPPPTPAPPPPSRSRRRCG